jgi:hypothetical protein
LAASNTVELRERIQEKFATLRGDLPVLRPVMFRGRKPRKRKPPPGLRWIEKQGAGRYPHTLKNGRRQETAACGGAES